MSNDPTNHAFSRAVGISERKIAYFPIPKAGCTSFLWLLAREAGYKEDIFWSSVGAETTRSMTIHDVSRWSPIHRWSHWGPELRNEAAGSSDWLLVTTVRDPVARLWSAWQSKVLLKEPWFVRRFAGRPWFAQPTGSELEIVSAFREFVKALGSEPDLIHADVHWSPQTLLLQSAPPITHVGRVESIVETVAAIASHLGRNTKDYVLTRENSGILPFRPALLDERCANIINDRYALDFEAFGYKRAFAGPAGDLWAPEVARSLQLLPMIVERHERIADLRVMARRGERVSQLAETIARRLPWKRRLRH